MRTARAGILGRGRRGGRQEKRGRGEGGAALVEFAIIAPLLFALLFGVIEFGYAFYQNLDVRHGAREGSRLAAVNYASGNTSSLTTEICDRLSKQGGIDFGVSVDRTLVAPNSAGDIGDEVTITVRKELVTITGFYDFLLDNTVLSSTVKTRLEQPSGYTTEALEALPGNDC